MINISMKEYMDLAKESMGQEPGHLPGNPDFTEMLSTDLSKEYLIYLRAVYMSWCKAEAEKRTVDIVSNQHRCFYKLAACLILSLAEFYAGRGKRADGFNLIQKYHQKYHRHRSFRQELTNATLKSGIF